MPISDVSIVWLQQIKCRLETQEEQLHDTLSAIPVGKERDTVERALINLRESIRELVEFT